MAKIQINRPVVKPLNVTGAALRSVQAADETANAVWTEVEKAAQCVEAVLDANPANTTVDATWIAFAFRNLKRLDEACNKVKTLVPRHSVEKNRNPVNTSAEWAMNSSNNGCTWQDAKTCIQGHAKDYHESLKNAGVPMAEPGVYTPEFWDDAAARGC